jgi:hypothetical protein
MSTAIRWFRKSLADIAHGVPRGTGFLLALAVVLSPVALLVFAACSAHAAEYTASVCRNADGTPAPTDGWAHVVTDDATGNIAGNSCAAGGHIDLALGAGMHGKAGGSASVMFAGSLPPGHSWSRMQVWAAFRSTPVGSAEDSAHLVAGTVAGVPLCSWGKGTGCSMFGSFSAAPLADVNRYTVTPSSPGQPLSVGVMCDSSPNPCPATSGDPYAQMRVWRIEVKASYPDPPPITPGDPSVPPPGAQPGTIGQARLTIRLRSRGTRRVRLTGRLANANGKPVMGARLVLRRQTVGDRAMFYRLTTRRDGTFARVLRRGRKTARVSVRWPTRNVTSRTVRIRAVR